LDHKHNSAGGDLPLAMPCNEPAEQVISLLVLYKYFVLSGPGRA
jgi:hypothetical protein